MPCQRPSASSPRSSGTSTCGLISEARMCDGAFGPSASEWRQPPSSATIRSIAASMSAASAGSLRPVPSGPPTPGELDAYRDEADRFIAELDEEYYLHFAGLKENLELEPIYERHQELTKLEWTQSLGESVDGDRRVRELWRFACEGHLGNLTKQHSERVATLETELEAEVDGEKVGYRMLRPTIANTDDRGKRERLDGARTRLTEEHLNPIYLDAVGVSQEAVPHLGAPNYLELYRKFGFRLDNLAGQCRSLLAETESMYEDATDKLFRDRIGIGLDEAKRWDVPRVFRAESWDEFFPADKMLPALEATLADLGIDLR